MTRNAPSTTSAVDTTLPTPTGNPGFQPSVLPADLSISQVMPTLTLDNGGERPSSGTVWIILGRRNEFGAVVDRMGANVDSLRKLYDAFGVGDVAAVLGAMDEQIEWQEPTGLRFENQLGPQAIAANIFGPVTTQLETSPPLPTRSSTVATSSR